MRTHHVTFYSDKIIVQKDRPHLLRDFSHKTTKLNADAVMQLSNS